MLLNNHSGYLLSIFYMTKLLRSTLIYLYFTTSLSLRLIFNCVYKMLSLSQD